jgi:hypothetical protein
VKSSIAFKKASGSTRRRVEDMVLGRHKFSPKQIAKRAVRRERRYATV